MKSSNKPSTTVQTGSTSGKGTQQIIGGNKGNKVTGQSPANLTKGNQTGSQTGSNIGTGGQTGRK